MTTALIDAGPLIAYFDKSDEWHEDASGFIDAFIGQFITTTVVITEVMWQLRSDHRVQNEFLRRVFLGLFQDEHLTRQDYLRIIEFSSQYSQQVADFADLSLLALAERLGIGQIVSIDSEFDYYRYRKGHRTVALKRILPRNTNTKSQ